MDDQAKKDLLLALGFLVLLFFVWLFSGGPSRPSSTSGPFIGISLKQAAENSIYKYTANLSFGSNAKKSDLQEEYIEIWASSSNKELINISNWSLENQNGIKVKIGQASQLPFLGEINQQQDILLNPGDKAIIVTGQSPIGTSFLINKCIGYLSQMQNFIPALARNCPDPVKDEMLPASLDNKCIDYITREFKLCTAYIALAAELSSSCKEYINERINYNGCARWHKRDFDFYKPEYRVYLKRSSELWNNDHEKIILYDENGEIIDWSSY